MFSFSFFFLQCKLEFQSCLSGKTITVKCDGLCPCLVDQDFSSAAQKTDRPGECDTVMFSAEVNKRHY